ncbi:hypothetical protein FD755_020973 [Muntiacus reevesi]|uniref:Reactive oxygen species modulator 1 n=1 Tax=Muntiacus reevesi TaxID=9886 RepID=A0A5N3X0E2_MUNRE|nr:hypothetical protein FD755_020973 [Muntiacus reevesi]
MLVALGPYGQSQPSCFDHMKLGFVMGCSGGMAAGLMGSIRKTMMQSDSTFGTFMAIGMGI